MIFKKKHALTRTVSPIGTILVRLSFVGKTVCHFGTTWVFILPNI